MASIHETFSRVSKVAIAAVFLVWKLSQTALFRLAGRPITATFVVLAYHSVKSWERERFTRQMDCLVRVAKVVKADFTADKTGQERTYVAVTFDDGYQSVLENAIPILSERYIPATLFVPTKYLGGRPAWITSGRHRNASERLLTTSELRDLREKGLSIGSHSVSHRSLTELSRAEALAEFVESRQALESILGQKVTSFAFPYGSNNITVRQLARQAGYERVFLGVPVGSARNGEAHVVGRIDVTPTDWPVEYYLKIRGAYQWLPLGIAAKSRVKDLLKKFAFATANHRSDGDARMAR